MAKSVEAAALAALQESRIFGGLSKRELKAISRYSREVAVPAGTVLVNEGETGAEFCIIRSGECEVSRNGQLTATLKAGESFGEIAVLDGKPRTATVTTTQPTELFVLGQPDFEHAMKVAPGLSQAILHQLCAHLRAANEVGTD
jgi:CRP/FNR family transcriptional regulator/CRP/FNR family cyclic AMP-dependent transcriptional regulator